MSGIDYGMGRTNIDRTNGIRYGVISQHSCPEFWNDSEADYGKPDGHTECPECEHSVALESDADWGDTVECDNCGHSFDLALPDCCEPIGFYVDDGTYKATSCLDSDIMIVASPYYTYADFCSPCVPGAGNLDSPTDDESGAKSYCLGHDAFENGIAPYPVYRVTDDVRLIAQRQPIECPNCKGTGKDSLERLALARQCDVAKVKSDSDLMLRLAQLNYDEQTGLFDCWRCNGKGQIEETIVSEAANSDSQAADDTEA